MALIPVRSREEINGKTFVTEVGEEHLERWPDDFIRLEGAELVRYQLRNAGVSDEYLDAAVEGVLALAEAGQTDVPTAVGTSTEAVTQFDLAASEQDTPPSDTPATDPATAPVATA